MIEKKIQRLLLIITMVCSVTSINFATNKVHAQTISPTKYSTQISYKNIKTNQEIIQSFINSYMKNRNFSNVEKNDITTFKLFFDKYSNLKEDQLRVVKPFVDFVVQKSTHEQFEVDLLHGYYEMYTNSSSLANYGFKGDIVKWVSNERPYDWYIDQGATGPYGNVNCAPSVATMSIMWANPYFKRTVEDARKEFNPNGQPWSNTMITDYLNEYKVYNYTMNIYDLNRQLKDLINLQNIVILIINPRYIATDYSSKSHVGTFYSDSVSHCILIKGYVQTASNLYFETYDPYSMGRTTDDGMLKGKNRYYDSKELYNAVTNYWDHLICVTTD